MFTTFLNLIIACLLLGLCISQKDATDREMRFRIKYHEFLYQTNKPG